MGWFENHLVGKLPPHSRLERMEKTAIALEILDSLARILWHCGIYEKL